MLYVYCMSKTAPVIGPEDGPEGLSCIESDGFFTVVKRVPENEYSGEGLKRQLADMQWLEARAREHVGVISRIMQQVCVIPFSFGTVYNTRENLAGFIRDHAASLDENFLLVGNSGPWGV